MKVDSTRAVEVPEQKNWVVGSNLSKKSLRIVELLMNTDESYCLVEVNGYLLITTGIVLYH